jgi:hypothetical protein
MNVKYHVMSENVKEIYAMRGNVKEIYAVKETEIEIVSEIVMISHPCFHVISRVIYHHVSRNSKLNDISINSYVLDQVVHQVLLNHFLGQALPPNPHLRCLLLHKARHQHKCLIQDGLGLLHMEVLYITKVHYKVSFSFCSLI